MKRYGILVFGLLSMVHLAAGAQEPEPGPDAMPPDGPAAASGSGASESGGADADAMATVPVEPFQPGPAEPVQADTPMQLDDIVVTATKRSESTRTLAGAVTAIGRERLDETGSSKFAEYLALSPGVNLNSGHPGTSIITMRGVSTDTMPTITQSAVGVYYDDIPLTDPGTPVLVPDIDAFDAERIEVLRGPQGALFGSSSLGGAINYIPQTPDPWAFAAAAQAAGGLTENADTGVSGKIMANVPIVSEAVGLRLVGYHTDTPGWIDNVGTGVNGANASSVSGGRAMLGWDIAPGSNLRLTGLYQKAVVDDLAYVDGGGDLQKESLIPEEFSNDIALGSLRYDNEAEYGSWSLIAGYQAKNNYNVSDQSVFVGLQDADTPAPGAQTQAVDGYSAELRFVSTPGDFFDFLAGLSYADRDEHYAVTLDAGPARLFYQRADLQAPEAAAFADTTFRITPSLKLTAGGRYYRNTVDADIYGEGLLLAPSGSLTFSQTSKTVAKGFNPRVSLAYQFDRDIMAYALYSKGYRLGGVNLVPNTPASPTRTEYGPDEVKNYELGTKTSWLGGALVVDVTGFYIDWKDIPLFVQDRLGLFRYLDNVGDARVYGVETSLAMRPADSLILRSAVTWNEATLQNFYDPQNGRPPVQPGDRLPGAPEWTVSNTVTGRWFIAGLDPVVTLVHRYESESPSSLSYKEIMKGDYHQFDLRAGAQIRGVGLTLFGRNLADKRGVTAVHPYARTDGTIYRRDFIITPRTFGLELNYSFGL
jgi:iron complex outermembrane recepter protein